MVPAWGLDAVRHRVSATGSYDSTGCSRAPDTAQTAEYRLTDCRLVTSLRE